MKIIFLILLFLGLSDPFKLGIYEYKKNGKTYSLEIKSDSTFIYERPAMFSGNIIESGNWKIHTNTLILIDSIATFYSKSSVTGNKLSNQDYITIKVTNENFEPLSNIKVSLNEDELFRNTNKDGIARFEFSELKKRRFNQPDSTIEIVTLKTKKWDQSSAVKNIFCNTITIVKDFNPKTIFEIRERKLKIEEDRLIFPNPSGMNKNQTFEFKRKK